MALALSRLMYARLFKRKKLIFGFACLLALSFAVASKETDPLLLAAEKLHAQTDAYFLFKGSDSESGSVKYLGSDWLKPIWDSKDAKHPSYQKLISEFEATKKILEQGFAKREIQSTKSQTVVKAASAAAIYLRQEKRLYLNLFRNIHQLQKGSTADFKELKTLDLILKSNVAGALYNNDARFGAKFNLKHRRDEEGGFNAIEYGAVPSELSEMEQTAIQSVPSRVGYQKLIKLMVARERMTNQWALNRMQGGLADLMTYPSCGPELHSFNDLGAGDFYQSLWAQDRGEEVVLLHPELAAATLNQPLFSASQMSKLMRDFFNRYPSFVQQNSDTSGFALNSESDRAEKEKYWNTAPKTIIDVVEKDWSLHSAAGVVSVTYPSDLTSDEEVAARIAWISQYYRKKVIVDTLVHEAVARGISEVKLNPAPARALAEKMVNAEAQALSREDLKQREANVLLVFSATPSKVRVERRRSERFDALLKRVEPAMSRAAQAGFVLSEIDRAVKEQRQIWLSSHKLLSSVSSQNWDQFQLGYLPLRGYLKDRVTLRNPNELSLFFSRKLSFWADLDSWWRRLGRAVPVVVAPLGPLVGLKTSEPLALAQQAKRMSRVASRIKSNEVVMRGLKSFFKELSQAYESEVQTLKDGGVVLTNANTPLYRILPGVAKSSYLKFKAEVSRSGKAKLLIAANQKHRIKITPRAESLAKLRVMPADQTRVAGFDPSLELSKLSALRTPKNNKLKPMKDAEILEWKTSLAARAQPVSDKTAVKVAHDPSQSSPKEISNYIDDESERKEAIDLYEQSLALLNLGEVISGRTELVRDELPLLNMIDTPLQMEHVLNHLDPEAKLDRQVTKSLLDQKFAAEIVISEMKSEEPLLALRMGTGENAKALGDGLGKYFDVRLGLNLQAVKSDTQKALLPAIRNARGLVKEACQADAVKKDPAFQNIFRGAPTLRAGVIAQNRAFAAYDAELKNEFRSKLEVFKDDWLDPLVTIAMWASTIAAVIYLSPVATAGIATMVATGSFSLSAFGVGALGVLETLEIAGTKGLVSLLVSGPVSKAIARLFLTQVVVWYNVNCIQYPHYAEYLLKVSQAQIQGQNAQVTHQDVVDFNELVADRKVNTYTRAALVLAPETFVLVKAGVTAAGLPAAAALSRLEATGGENGEFLAESLRPKTMSQLIEEQGTLTGVAKYGMGKLSALKSLGRINTLASNASTEKLRELLAADFSEMLGDDVPVLRDLYVNRANYLNQEGLRIMSAFRKGNLISKVKGGSFTVNPSLQEWVRNKATQIGFKNTPYWKIVVAEDELEAMQTGKLLEGRDSEAEIAGLVQYAYVKGILAERDFMLQNKAVLDVLMNAGQLSGKQVLAEHFRVMSDADWSRIENLFQWQSVRSDGVIMASLNSRWMSDSPALVSVKKTFRDYHRLRDEADLISARSFGKEANSYFSAAGDHQGADLLIEKGSPSGRYVEIFFDPDAFLALPNP